MATKVLIEAICRQHHARLEIERGRFDNLWFVTAEQRGEVPAVAYGPDLDESLQEVVDRLEQQAVSEWTTMLKESARPGGGDG